MTAEKALVSRFSVISHLSALPVASDEPNCEWTYAHVNCTDIVRGRNLEIDGSGVSLDKERAHWKAIGEGVERYCCGFRRKADLPGSHSCNEVEGAVGADRFVSFAQWQYRDGAIPFSNPLDDYRIGWTKGINISTRKEVYLPAQFVYLPYDPLAGEAIFDDLISTGLACGPTMEWAAQKAIAEIIERDAFMFTWRTRCDVVEVDNAVLGCSSVQEWRRRISEKGLDIQIGYLDNLFNLPVAICCLSPRIDAMPHFVCGVSGATSCKAAVISAIEEAVQSFIGLRRMIGQKDTGFDPTDLKTITATHRHGKLYAIRPDLARLAWDIFRPTKSHVDRVEVGSLEELSELTSRENKDAFLIDLTTEDVALCGLRVVRCLIPGMIALDVDARYAHCGGRLARESIVNWLPHPFP